MKNCAGLLYFFKWEDRPLKDMLYGIYRRRAFGAFICELVRYVK